MKHSMFTKVLAVVLTFALLIPGGALLASAECEHDFSVKKVITPATCDTKGVVHYLCSKCEEEEKDDGGNAIDYYTSTIHEQIADGSASKNQYYTETTEATCEDAGVIDYYCKICNDWIFDEEIEALGHDPIPKITQEATVDHPGVKATICGRCGKTMETETFTIHDHYCDPDNEFGYKRILTPATCTQDGELGSFCAVCGVLFAVEPIEATGHYNAQWADYMTSTDTVPEDYIGYTNVETVMPTCTKAGTITFLCDECGEVVRSYPLDKTGHHNDCLTDYNEKTDADPMDYIGGTNVVATLPTCTEDGSIEFLCEDCGIVVKTFKLDATGHYNSDLEWYLTDSDAKLEDCNRNVEFTPATCTGSGKITFLCDNCGEAMRSYTLGKTGHTDGYEKVITAATCTTAGEKGTYCADCGELIATTVIEALDHAYGEWTKNDDGTHSRSCSRCQFTDKAKCTYNATETYPTCTEDGYTTYVCAECGYTFVADYVEAFGHDWSEWKDNEDGASHTHVCSVCGETETEGHFWSEWVYNHDACLFKCGTKTRVCMDCGASVTEKAKHTSWICQVLYPVVLWLGSVAHKLVYVVSFNWFLPCLNLRPEI